MRRLLAILHKHALAWLGALVVTVVTTVTGVIWSRLDAADAAISAGAADRAAIKADRVNDHELLLEIRQDIKETRDAVRRLEGARDARSP